MCVGYSYNELMNKKYIEERKEEEKKKKKGKKEKKKIRENLGIYILFLFKVWRVLFDLIILEMDVQKKFFI